MPHFGADPDQPVELEFTLDSIDLNTNEATRQTFTRRRAVNLQRLASMGRDADRSDPLELVLGQFDVILVPESAQKLRTLAYSDDVGMDLGALTAALSWVMGELTGDRPTSRQPSSPSGLSNAEPSLPVVSGSLE